MVIYAIEDDGNGVTEDEQEQIFDPGVRGTAGETYRGTSGAGLGLSLARRLARTVDGDVVAKALNHGLFVIRLPSG